MDMSSFVNTCKNETETRFRNKLPSRTTKFYSFGVTHTSCLNVNCQNSLFTPDSWQPTALQTCLRLTIPPKIGLVGASLSACGASGKRRRDVRLPDPVKACVSESSSRSSREAKSRITAVNATLVLTSGLSSKMIDWLTFW